MFPSMQGAVSDGTVFDLYVMFLNNFVERQLWRNGDCVAPGQQWSLVREGRFQGAGDKRRKIA